MKKRSFLMAAFAAMFMASCSDNDLTQENGSQIAEKDGQLYMKVSIASPNASGTRALGTDPAFDNGTPDESRVKEILFVFYNDARNYVGESLMKYSTNSTLKEDEFGSPSFPNQDDGGSVETLLTMVVPVKVNAGGRMPYYVVAYVNPVETNQAAKNPFMDDLSSITRSKDKLFTETTVGEGDEAKKEKAFVMNSSVYYASTTSEAPTFASVIDYLAPTPEDAESDVNKEKITRIYVERICAKVTVNNESGGLNINGDGTSIGTNVVAGTTKDIKFHPVGWDVNAVAKNTYLLKQFRATKEGKPVSYVSVNNRFDAYTTKPGWNENSFHRSYWCASLNYSYSDYPEVASNDSEDQPLDYLSYNDIKKNNTWGGTKYITEHTVSNVSARLSAYTSIVVAGYYTLGDATEAATFYTYGVNNPTDKLPVVYESDETNLKKLIVAMSSQVNPVLKRTSEGESIKYKYSPLTEDELATVYEVKRPIADVLGSFQVPARYVYLQVKSGLTPGSYFYVDDEEQYKDVTENLNDVNSRMMKGGIPATIYKDGMAYYNVPIEHFGEVNNSVAYGSYGVVRNHAYVINVKGIKGLGTGIADPGTPIIPPTEEQKYYVKTQLNVLAWRVMANQNVTLGE